MSSIDKFSLEGRVALITGAAGLLGSEHAIALLEKKATVVLTDISDEALKKTKERLLSLGFSANQVITKNMDVTRVEHITEVHESLKTAGHEVEILINNAAIDPKVKAGGGLTESSRFEKFALQQWNMELNVGLTGAFLCSQVFGTAMSQRKKGVILNIASDLSIISPDQRLYHKPGLADSEQPVKPVTYSVIKAGLVGLTRYLSTYWADRGVRANALSPGGVFNQQDAEFVTRVSSLIPMGRMATQDEYRGTIQYLCSDASAYLNGQNIVMDGGRSVW